MAARSRKIAIMAMLDSKSTNHVTIDVVIVNSQKEIESLIESVTEIVKQNGIKKITIHTDATHFPKFITTRALAINPNSFARTNANHTMTGSFSSTNKVMLVDSPEIGLIRNQLTKCCHPHREKHTSAGNYVPHRLISSWHVATSLPIGTIFTSNRIVFREIGKQNVAEIVL